MCPKISSGVGTVADAGRWSTDGVKKNGSVVNSRILAVYSWSVSWAMTGGATSIVAKVHAVSESLGFVSYVIATRCLTWASPASLAGGS